VFALVAIFLASRNFSKDPFLLLAFFFSFFLPVFFALVGFSSGTAAS
jgi:hypothetical protein